MGFFDFIAQIPKGMARGMNAISNAYYDPRDFKGQDQQMQRQLADAQLAQTRSGVNTEGLKNLLTVLSMARPGSEEWRTALDSVANHPSMPEQFRQRIGEVAAKQVAAAGELNKPGLWNFPAQANLPPAVAANNGLPPQIDPKVARWSGFGYDPDAALKASQIYRNVNAADEAQALSGYRADLWASQAEKNRATAASTAAQTPGKVGVLKAKIAEIEANTSLTPEQKELLVAQTVKTYVDADTKAAAAPGERALTESQTGLNNARTNQVNTLTPDQQALIQSQTGQNTARTNQINTLTPALEARTRADAARQNAEIAALGYNPNDPNTIGVPSADQLFKESMMGRSRSEKGWLPHPFNGRFGEQAYALAKAQFIAAAQKNYKMAPEDAARTFDAMWDERSASNPNEYKPRPKAPAGGVTRSGIKYSVEN